MFGKHFYHQSLRRLIIAFGTIFNNITIHRKDSSNNVVQSIKVPLSYSPKEKFLARLDEQADLTDKRVAVTLRRLGFEITNIAYDPSRKLQRVNKYRQVRTSVADGKVMDYQYNPVPYNISMNLYSFTATALY